MGLYDEIVKRKEYELTICFPASQKEQIQGEVDGVKFYSFYQPRKLLGFLPDTLKRSSVTELHFKTVWEEVVPDVLYVFGTEYIHSRIAVETFARPKRSIVNIQGLVSAYKYYYADLPLRVIYGFTFSNLVRGSIARQRAIQKKRGMNEIATLKKAGHVVGRTDWDYAHTRHINPEVEYHCCNESLRASFYNPPRLWSYNHCQQHSIFMSQGSYPIKGLHYLLWALPIIKQWYPDVHVNVSGPNPIKDGSLRGRLEISSYGLYLRMLIKKYSLKENITFLGKLDQDEMVNAYLTANVYLLASSIENSPNSLGEAMLLGVPCVASDVGGVKTMMTHNNDGFLYQHNETDMLADSIIRMFDLQEAASQYGDSARLHALQTHHRAINCQNILEVYEKVASI